VLKSPLALLKNPNAALWLAGRSARGAGGRREDSAGSGVDAIGGAT
jgi:hypothetical protein